MFLSVVIPCRNETPSLGSFKRRLFPALDALGESHEILAVDDGSTDGTATALRELAQERSDFKVLSHEKNRGLGAALRTGFASATGDWIVTLDADLTFDPSQIAALIEAQRRTNADLVAGSPFLTPEGLSRASWSRRWPSALANALYRMACGCRLTAYTPIFRLYRASALRSMPLHGEGFEINAEIAALFLAHGKAVAEVPAILTVRESGRSKLSPLREFWRHGRLLQRLLREAQ